MQKSLNCKWKTQFRFKLLWTLLNEWMLHCIQQFYDVDIEIMLFTFKHITHVLCSASMKAFFCKRIKQAFFFNVLIFISTINYKKLIHLRITNVTFKIKSNHKSFNQFVRIELLVQNFRRACYVNDTQTIVKVHWKTFHIDLLNDKFSICFKLFQIKYNIRFRFLI